MRDIHINSLQNKKAFCKIKCYVLLAITFMLSIVNFNL